MAAEVKNDQTEALHKGMGHRRKVSHRDFRRRVVAEDPLSTKAARRRYKYVLPSRTPVSHSHNEVIREQASYIQDNSLSRAKASSREGAGMATRYRSTQLQAVSEVPVVAGSDVFDRFFERDSKRFSNLRLARAVKTAEFMAA